MVRARLAQAQVPRNNLVVSRSNFALVAIITLTLLRLLFKNVALISLAAHNFASSRYAKALCGTSMRLHFWHLLLPFLQNL